MSQNFIYIQKIVSLPNILSSAVRPTEIAESDVFVCESTYDELKKQIRRNHPGTALRKFKHSQLVTQDEIYHFKRPIAPAKVTQSEYFMIVVFLIDERKQLINFCLSSFAIQILLIKQKMDFFS